MCVCVCECPQSCIIDKSGGIWACVITHLLLYTCTHTHIQPPTNLRTQIHVGCLHVCMPTHTHSHAQPHTHTHTQVSILSEEMRRAASNRDAVQAAKDHMHTHTGVNIEWRDETRRIRSWRSTRSNRSPQPQPPGGHAQYDGRSKAGGRCYRWSEFFSYGCAAVCCRQGLCKCVIGSTSW